MLTIDANQARIIRDALARIRSQAPTSQKDIGDAFNRIKALEAALDHTRKNIAISQASEQDRHEKLQQRIKSLELAQENLFKTQLKHQTEIDVLGDSLDRLQLLFSLKHISRSTIPGDYKDTGHDNTKKDRQAGFTAGKSSRPRSAL
jgi:chromosome segregation ATPase